MKRSAHLGSRKSIPATPSFLKSSENGHVNMDRELFFLTRPEFRNNKDSHYIMISRQTKSVCRPMLTSRINCYSPGIWGFYLSISLYRVVRTVKKEYLSHLEAYIVLKNVWSSYCGMQTRC
jgi:hypothetical protein